MTTDHAPAPQAGGTTLPTLEEMVAEPSLIRPSLRPGQIREPNFRDPDSSAHSPFDVGRFDFKRGKSEVDNPYPYDPHERTSGHWYHEHWINGFQEAQYEAEKEAEAVEGTSEEFAALSRSPAVAPGVPAGVVRGIYIASKAIHGPRWRDLRAAGWPIISTWIDESEAGRTTDWAGLWDRCASEPALAAVTVLYAEDGEVLKGALVEVGAALSHGRKVIVVGPVDHTWTNHRNVEFAATLPIALIRARWHIEQAAALAPDAQAGAMRAANRWTPAPNTSADDADAGTVLASVRQCAQAWSGEARLLGNVRAKDIVRAINDVEVRLAASGTAPAGGLPGVEEIAEARRAALTEVLQHVNALAASYRRSVRLAMDPASARLNEDRVSTVEAIARDITARINRLAASETGGLSDLRADRSTLDEPIPDFEFTPGAFVGALRQAVADDKGLTIILPARSTRDMLAWAEGVASGTGDAGRSVAVKTVSITPDPERAYTLAEMDGLVAAMEPAAPSSDRGEATDGVTMHHVVALRRARTLYGLRNPESVEVSGFDFERDARDLIVRIAERGWLPPPTRLDDATPRPESSR